MGAMHTQLMGAPSMGNESDATMTQCLIRRQSRLAVFWVNYLARPVQQVWSQGKVYLATSLNIIFQQSHIFLLNLMLQELLLQRVIGIQRKRYYHHT